MRNNLTLILSMTLGLTLAGCSAHQPEALPTTTLPSASELSPTATASAPTQDATAEPSTDEAMVDSHTGETITPMVVPEWDAASEEAVVQTANDALAAWLSTDLGPEEWWAGVEPFFTQEAAEAYATVDPENIPPFQITGSGTLVENQSAYIGVVEVPTDGGPYRVMLNRADGAAPWMVLEITPPEGV